MKKRAYRPLFHVYKSGLHLKQLNALSQDYLSINTLRCHIPDLAIGGVEFVEPLDSASDTVSNPVVVVVTECHG